MSILIVFTATLREGVEEKYSVLSREVLEEAQKQPGLLSLERGRSVMRERGIISVSEWASEEALEAWRNHPIHRRAREIAVRELFETHELKKAQIE